MNDKINLKEVNLYYLNSDFDSVIFKLCSSLLKENICSIINLNSYEEALSLEKYLWVKNKTSFLPHIMHTENITSLDHIVLLDDEYKNFKKYDDFDLIIFSPNVVIDKLNNFRRFFLFSYFEKKEKCLLHKQKLLNKGFKVKSFVEKNMKWDIL